MQVKQTYLADIWLILLTSASSIHKAKIRDKLDYTMTETIIKPNITDREDL